MFKHPRPWAADARSAVYGKSIVQYNGWASFGKVYEWGTGRNGWASERMCITTKVLDRRGGVAYVVLLLLSY